MCHEVARVGMRMRTAHGPVSGLWGGCPRLHVRPTPSCTHTHPQSSNTRLKTYMSSGKTQEDFLRAIDSPAAGGACRVPRAACPRLCACGLDGWTELRARRAAIAIDIDLTTSFSSSPHSFALLPLPPPPPTDAIEQEIAAIAKSTTFLPERYFSFGLCKVRTNRYATHTQASDPAWPHSPPRLLPS